MNARLRWPRAGHAGWRWCAGLAVLLLLVGGRPAAAQVSGNPDSLSVAHLRLDTLPRLYPEEMLGLWNVVPLVRSPRTEWYHFKADSTFDQLAVRAGLCSRPDGDRSSFTGMCHRRSLVRSGRWWVLERRAQVASDWLCLSRSRAFDGRCYQILDGPYLVMSEIRLAMPDLDVRLALVARDAQEVFARWDREP